MSLWVLMGVNGSVCVHMESSGFLWVLIRPYGSLCVLMDSSGSLFFL